MAICHLVKFAGKARFCPRLGAFDGNGLSLAGHRTENYLVTVEGTEWLR